MRTVRCSLFAVVLAASGTVPAASLAQAHDLPAPRQVTVRLSASGVRAPDSLAAGRYRLQVRAPGRGPAVLLLVKPDRGYTRADLRADERRGGRAAIRRIRANLRFFGGVELRAGGSGTLWETLYAGRYWLVGVTADRARGYSMKTVRVHGSPFASSFPRVSAQATSLEDGLRITRRVPRPGRMLIRNSSHRFDTLFLLPLRKGATYADFLRWHRHPRSEFPVRFRGFRSTAPLSPDAGYVLRYRLRPGNYVAMGIRGANALFSNRPRQQVRRLIRPVTVRPGTRAKARHRLTPSMTGFLTNRSTRNTWDTDWPRWATR